jgi:hypothetical protein
MTVSAPAVTVIASAANAAPPWSPTSAEAVAAAIPTYANEARIDRRYPWNPILFLLGR